MITEVTTAIDGKPLSERSAKVAEQIEKLTAYFNERGEAADARDKAFKANIEKFERDANALFAAFEKYRATLDKTTELAAQWQCNYQNLFGLLADVPDIIHLDRGTPEFKALFQVMAEEKAKKGKAQS
jgi:hypothetical protein